MSKLVKADFFNRYGVRVGLTEARQRRMKREAGWNEPEPTEAETKIYWRAMAKALADFAKGSLQDGDNDA